MRAGLQPATAGAQKSIAGAPQAPDSGASDAFAAFIGKLGLPRRLSDVGVREEKFKLMGENAMLSIFTRSNPQPIRDPADLVEILRLAT
jgi:maleylacetate reductase